MVALIKKTAKQRCGNGGRKKRSPLSGPISRNVPFDGAKFELLQKMYDFPIKTELANRLGIRSNERFNVFLENGNVRLHAGKKACKQFAEFWCEEREAYDPSPTHWVLQQLQQMWEDVEGKTIHELM